MIGVIIEARIYNNIKNGIYETTEFLEIFLNNRYSTEKPFEKKYEVLTILNPKFEEGMI